MCRIIAASQQSYPSPSKTPHTSKYDYMSPIKSVKKTQPQKPSNQQTKVQKLVEPSRPKTEPPQMKNANNEKKKRVALFSPTASKQYEGVNLDDLDSSMQKLDFDDSKLAERMNAPSSKMENLGELKMLTSSNRNGKNQNRKSLNSEGNSDKGRKPMNKNHSSGSLNLADFIVEKPKKKKGKKKNKQSLEDRLNPKPNLNDSSSSLNTSCSDLNTSADSSILDVSNISTALDLESSMESRLDTSASTVQGHNTSMESACSDIDPVRKDIWQDIVKHIEHSKGVQVSEISPRPQNETPTKEVKRFAKADPEKVTMRTSLDNLAKVYTLCLAKGLTPSVLMELFLMAELLVIQQSEKDEKFVNQLFGSLHNCVYFACKVLSSQSHMLQFLDKNTCALICSMERVERFEPELKAKLLSLTVTSGQQEVDMGKKNRSEILESIRFQTEKDNQSNFPNDRVFQDFKKQRDQFYEVLRNWKAKDKKFASDPAKNTAQSRKVASKAQDQFEESVRRLLNIQHHPVNMAHLARLFRDQMLTTCSAEALDRKESDVMDEIRTRADPTKMMSLQKRFGSGLGGVDVSLEQQYLGSERFFKDFIKCSNDSIFLEHLKRALIESIGEKNKEIFTVKDFEDNKLEDGHQSVSRLVQEEVSNTIITLRIAAKFLAFIDAMPYNCDVKALSEAMVLEQINIRSQIRPPLSLQTMLKEALQKKRLILTLPWMVEFCLNLDPIALQLPHYQRLLELMATIYKSVLTETNPVYVLDSLNSFYLKLILGSMFEKTWVPREYFVDNCDEATVLMEKIISQREFHLPNTLDENQVILRDLIHICCPHITDLKAILRQFTSGKKTNVLNSQEMVKNNSEVTKSNAEKSKKVYLRLTSEEEADVADEDKEDDEEASLHKSMEQNFFHNQSIAIKKSVHFVAERLAVKMTAKISNEILVSVLEKLESHVRSSVEAAMDMSDGEVNDVIAAEVKAEVEEIAIGHMTMTKRLAMDLVLKELPGQVEDAILLLLPEGMGEASRRMSVRIAVKQAQVICFNWVKEHVTKTLFLKRGRKMCDSAFGAGKAPKTDRRESVTVENDDIEDVKLPSKAFITMRVSLCNFVF